MKYLVQKRLRNFAIATTLVGTTVANSATVFAMPITSQQGDITNDESNGRDLSGFGMVTPSVPRTDLSEEDYDGVLDDFETITPTVPTVDERDLGDYETITPAVPRVDERDLGNFETITPTVPTVGETNMGITPAASGKEVVDGITYGFYDDQYGGVGIASHDLPFNHLDMDSLEPVKLIIPDTLGGKPVTSIGAWASFSYSNITELTLPDSIVMIDDNTFNNNNITKLNLPSSLKYIGSYAFAYNNITELTLNEGLEKIGQLAFSNNQIDELNIPSSVRYLEGFNDNKLTEIVIPNSVEIVGYAFGNNAITNVTIGSGVEKIGYGAFHNNPIGYVDIPDSVTHIGESAFYNCQLTSIEIPNTTTRIDDFAFQNNNISHVVIPASVTWTGGKIFYNNPLESVILEESTDLRYMLGSEFVYGIGSDDEEYPKYNDNNFLDELILPGNLYYHGYSSYYPIGDTDYALSFKYISNMANYAIVNKSTDFSYKPLFNSRDLATLDKEREAANAYNEEYFETELFRSSRTEDIQSLMRYDNFAYLSGGSVGAGDGYSTVDSLYRDYEVKLVDFEELSMNDVTFEDGSTSLSALSFISVDEGIQLLNDNIPVKEGYVFDHWILRTTQGLKTLQLDGDVPAKYVVGDLKGVTPVFVPASTVDPLYLSLEVDEATQHDAVSTVEDATVAISAGSTNAVTPGQVIDVTLDDGYSFIIGEDFYIDAVNMKNGFEEVTVFSDTNRNWEYIIYDNYISIKAPSTLELTNPANRFGVVLSNFGIKTTDTSYVPTTVREVNVTVETNGNQPFSKRIATLEFERSILLFLDEATKKNAYETEKDGKIAVVSNMKYSFNDNQTFIIDLDDGFQFTHNYSGNIEATAEDFEFINTYAEGVHYVPSVNDFRNDSEEWQFTTSEDFNKIYVKTPTNLHGNGASPAMPSTTTTAYNPEAGGVGFRINGIGIKDIAGEHAGVPRTVNLSVTTQDGFVIGSGEFAQLVPTNIGGGNGGGTGGTGGGSGGNVGTTTPNEKETPVYEEVTYQPYINGYADGSIRTNSSITRAEVAGIIYNIYGNGQAGNMASLNRYTDLKTNVWYSEAVAYCLNNGIFVGYENMMFKPNDFITREELAVVLNSLNVENIDSTQKSSNVYLTDIQNSWAKDEIEELVARGIVSGYPDGEFKLKNYTTRGEFIALMNRTTGRPAEYKVENTFNDLESGKWYYDEVMNASNVAFEMVLKETK